MLADDEEGLALEIFDGSGTNQRFLAVRDNPALAGAHAKFSTYAAHWIKQSIRRAIDNTRGVVRLPVHKQDKMRRTGQSRARDLSLDVPVCEGGHTWLDRLTAEQQDDYLPEFDRAKLEALVDALPCERDRDVLRGRFWRDETLGELGDRWGVTRERIRQIEAALLARLRADPELAPD